MTPSISPRDELTFSNMIQTIKDFSLKEWSFIIGFAVIVLWPFVAVVAFWSEFLVNMKYISAKESFQMSAAFICGAPLIGLAAMWLSEKGFMVPLMTGLSFLLAGFVFWNMKGRAFDGSQAFVDAYFIGGCMSLACMTFVYQWYRYGRFGDQTSN